MAPYLILTAIIAIIAVLYPQRRPHPFAWMMTYIALVIFIGLRHKVGMDWNNYLYMAERVGTGSLLESFNYAEPAYAALLWISVQLGMGVYGANFVGAAVVCAGVLRYARTTPSPWLALTVALPILLIVVAMSANRQAIAIGVLLWLIATWEGSSVTRRTLFILLASMFHVSAVFLLIFVAFDLKIRPAYKAILSAFAVAAVIGFMQYSGGADRYDATYVSGQSEMTYSPGAQLHVLLNGLPAALLVLGRRIRKQLFPSPLHLQMALLALAMVPLAAIISAAAGRMSLYLFPVSMYVFSALPKFVNDAAGRILARLLLGGVFVTMAWFWLAYANSSLAHVPYRNALFMHPSELHIR